MGLTKTLSRIGQNFIWPGMKKDAQDFVLVCLQCQQTKYDHQKSPGLLCPLSVPLWPWEDLSLDFIGGLPASRGYTVILVMVDRFSKGVHLGVLRPNYITSTVSILFMEIVGKLHGMPRSLVSDCDPLFVSRFWQELFKLSGTKLRMSSAYHPQSDKQTEVMNMDVLKQPIQSTDQNQEISDKEASAMHSRSKRQITRPHYLKDFITNSNKGCWAGAWVVAKEYLVPHGSIFLLG